MPPETKPNVAVAVQEYDIEGILRSIQAKINLAVACKEVGDNFRDKSRPPQSLVYQFYPDEARIIITGEGTTGMNDEEMKRFIKFGRFERDLEAGKIGQHGFGGKESLLWWLTDQGSLRIFSQPPNSFTSYEMNIDRWWKNLGPGLERPIKPRSTAARSERGRTIFELTSVQESRNPRTRTALAELADELGSTYAQDIQSGKLSMKLQLFVGRRVEEINVLPTVVPISRDDFFKEKKNERTGRKGEGPRINVSWGMLDNAARNSSEALREKAYRISPDHLKRIHGNRVFLYYNGRMLGEVELKKLAIPGYTSRHVFESFAVTVDILDPVEMDIFKTGVAVSSKEEAYILYRVKKMIQEDINTIAKDTDPERIPAGYRKRAADASDVLRSVLKALYHKQSEIAKVFKFPFGSIYDAEEERRRQVGSSSTSKEPSGKTRDKTGKKEPKYALPEVKVGYFPGSWPRAEVALSEGEKSVIQLNLKNETVKRAFNLRSNADSLHFVLDVVAEELFSEKGLRLNPQNASTFWEGFQREVREFMEKASEEVAKG